MSDPQNSGPTNPKGEVSDPFQVEEPSDAGQNIGDTAGGPPDSVVEGVEGGAELVDDNVMDDGADNVVEASADGSDENAQEQDPAKLLELAQIELKNAVDESLRSRAEMDNVRKRAARDTDNARKFALEKLMTDMLDVTESLERGLLAAEGDQVTVQQMVEGTELTFRMLEKVLSKHGLEAVVPENEVFDPERHEALSLIPTADCAPDTVVQVVQKGYVLNGRLLRPARVLVAKAPDA